MLTPSTIRTDLKCGKGAIRPGQKCSKGAAQTVEKSLQIGGMVGAGASFIHGVRALTKGNTREAQKSFAATNGFMALHAVGKELKGKRTHNKEMQRKARTELGVSGVLAGANLALASRPQSMRTIIRPLNSPSIAQNQRAAAESRQQAIQSIPGLYTGIPSSTTPPKPKSPPASYVPQTPEERRVHAARTAIPPASKTKHPDPYPDVSAAWRQYKDSVWAEGFEP